MNLENHAHSQILFGYDPTENNKMHDYFSRLAQALMISTYSMAWSLLVIKKPISSCYRCGTTTMTIFAVNPILFLGMTSNTLTVRNFQTRFRANTNSDLLVLVQVNLKNSRFCFSRHTDVSPPASHKLSFPKNVITR